MNPNNQNPLKIITLYSLYYDQQKVIQPTDPLRINDTIYDFEIYDIKDKTTDDKAVRSDRVIEMIVSYTKGSLGFWKIQANDMQQSELRIVNATTISSKNKYQFCPRNIYLC